MRYVFLICLPLLAACQSGVLDQVARAQARQTAHRVLQTHAPGLPLEPATDCVIDNASAGELLGLAKLGVTRQPTPEAIDTVMAVLTRPETVNCLGTQGLAPFLR